jgi:NADPH:quinone reductase-like Zn-dependent oxidoreductase
MKAAVNDRYGPPDLVRIAEVAKPTANDHELLVKVQATTVNRTDCGFRGPRGSSRGSSPGCDDRG